MTLEHEKTIYLNYFLSCISNQKIAGADLIFWKILRQTQEICTANKNLILTTQIPMSRDPVNKFKNDLPRARVARFCVFIFLCVYFVV